MITLSNFTNTLDKKQVSKGKDYYLDAPVENLLESKPHLWQAEVEGTELYHVKVQLFKQEIKDTSCDCPHEDPFCKHVVAVLFALQDELDIEEESEAKQQKKKTQQRKNLCQSTIC